MKVSPVPAVFDSATLLLASVLTSTCQSPAAGPAGIVTVSCTWYEQATVKRDVVQAPSPPRSGVCTCEPKGMSVASLVPSLLKKYLPAHACTVCPPLWFDT